MTKVEEYIRRDIGKALCEDKEDTEAKFGLPYPYSVPTVGETFHAMFYWDTYFTNLALIALGDIAQVKNNIDNIAYLINRFGFMPNGSTPGFIDRSQPPFFALMIKDALQFIDDKEWEKEMYSALKKEHSFWIEKRSTKNGLQHYGTDVWEQNVELYAKCFCSRVGVEYDPDKKEELAKNFLAQAESGWDFNPRLELTGADYCTVDLNALIWASEKVLSDLAVRIGNGEESVWLDMADNRAKLMREFLIDGEGVFRDRNAENGRFSPVFSTASLYPLFVGLANEKEAAETVKKLPLLLHKHGICPCEVVGDGRQFQWGAPNGWPCLQVVASEGLYRYGYKSESENIGNLYVDMVEKTFEKTGALWEKYNLDSGSNDAVNEYEMPEMLGWTAGAYLFFIRKYR